jgi:Stress responsive A/B Barrel Domain
MTHVVLLQLKAEIRPEEIYVALKHVETLQEAIPGIIDVQTGENRSMNHQGYTYGFVMHFVDGEHLKAYAPHPAHRVVSQELVRICSSIIDFDIE